VNFQLILIEGTWLMGGKGSFLVYQSGFKSSVLKSETSQANQPAQGAPEHRGKKVRAASSTKSLERQAFVW